MPASKSNRTTVDARIADLQKMSGHDFAMEVSRDLIVLPKDERAKAVRMITIINDTITKEVATA